MSRMTLGTVIFIALMAYGFGAFWYILLTGHLPASIWRTVALPFAATALGLAYFHFGPSFKHTYPLVTLIASLVGVLVDLIISYVRQVIPVPQSKPAESSR
jgi:hypothetical protein